MAAAEEHRVWATGGRVRWEASSAMAALACAGVLDMKWRHSGDSDPVLAVAESSGAVSLLSVHQDEEAVCHLETSPKRSDGWRAKDKPSFT